MGVSQFERGQGGLHALHGNPGIGLPRRFWAEQASCNARFAGARSMVVGGEGGYPCSDAFPLKGTREYKPALGLVCNIPTTILKKK